MRSELISVIVPIHNVELYLARCLNSLLAQTYSNLEIICVDDCSSDGSTRIAKAYAADYERIRLICHDCNMGLGPARNTGLKQASGPLVGFVDSDDYVHASMYEKLYRLLVEHRADIAQCSAFFVNEEGTVLNKRPGASGCCRNVPLLCLYGPQDSPEFVGAAWNKLYKKKLFMDYGIEYPSHYFEDIPVMVRLLYYAKSVASLEEGLYYYVQRDDSIVNKVSYDHIAKLVSSQHQSRKAVFTFLKSHNALIPDVVMRYREQVYYRTELIIETILSATNIVPKQKHELIVRVATGWSDVPQAFSECKLKYIRRRLGEECYDMEELKVRIMLELHRIDTMNDPSTKIMASFYFRMAACHVRMKEYDLALKAFSAVLENDPARLEIHLNRSDSLRYLGHYDDAFAEVDALEAKQRKFPGIWETRAKIWIALKREEEAQECLDKEISRKGKAF